MIADNMSHKHEEEKTNKQKNSKKICSVSSLELGFNWSSVFKVIFVLMIFQKIGSL